MSTTINNSLYPDGSSIFSRGDIITFATSKESRIVTKVKGSLITYRELRWYDDVDNIFLMWWCMLSFSTLGLIVIDFIGK